MGDKLFPNISYKKSSMHEIRNFRIFVTMPSREIFGSAGVSLTRCVSWLKTLEKKTMKNIRLGLCCIFIEYPIRFRIKQARYIARFARRRQLEILSATVLENCKALLEAVRVCHSESIGSFRVNSRFFPLKTHPAVRYELGDLPDRDGILETLAGVRIYCKQKGIRLTFHPDQFILLTSPKKDVVTNSIADLLYHDELADLIGADVITIHAGGAYGDKRTSLAHLKNTVMDLPESLRGRLALENDDRIFSPMDLIPLCNELELPFVYDIHHHRCLADLLSEEQATEAALTTWNREPLFHLSSPKGGWQAPNPRAHDDMINPDDFPDFWLDLSLTVEIEAKAKEQAVKRLQVDLGKRLAGKA